MSKHYQSVASIIKRKVSKARQSKDFDFEGYQEATFNMVYKTTKTVIKDGVASHFTYNSSATHQTIDQIVKLINELFDGFEVKDLRVSELGSDNLRYYKPDGKPFGMWIGNLRLKKALGVD